MFFDITQAHYDSEYRIHLEFEDGSKGTVDFSDYIKPETVFEAFKDIAYFKKFQIAYGTLIWGEGEVDIAPEALYERATGKQVRYSSKKNVV
ncbi:MAG: DUF2442 domain-containing protein [Spirochaetota bacterium]|nr:DUF2442 domain-containing protein [Spirochaetota bacterium]